MPSFWELGFHLFGESLVPFLSSIFNFRNSLTFDFHNCYAVFKGLLRAKQIQYDFEGGKAGSPAICP